MSKTAFATTKKEENDELLKQQKSLKCVTLNPIHINIVEHVEG